MTHWQDRAACAGHPDPDLFTDAKRADAARAVCGRCPVVDPCRTAGQDVAVGTWGGQFHERKTAKSYIGRARL